MSARPIFTLHLPNNDQHLAAVRADMERLGRPHLEVVDYGHTLVLLDGVHRLQAAYQLEMRPLFDLIRPTPTTLLSDLPLLLGQAESLKLKASTILLQNWVILRSAMLQATFGEAGIRFMLTNAGRLELVTNYDPRKYSESVHFERWLCDPCRLEAFGLDPITVAATAKAGMAGGTITKGDPDQMAKWHYRQL